MPPKRGRGGRGRGRGRGGSASRGRGGSASRGRGAARARTKAPSPTPFLRDEPLELLNENGEVVAHGSLITTPDGRLQRRLHGHEVAELQEEGGKAKERYVIVRIAEVVDSHSGDGYPYYMKGADVPETLADMYPLNNYIWDMHRLRRHAAQPEQGQSSKPTHTAVQKRSSHAGAGELTKNPSPSRALEKSDKPPSENRDVTGPDCGTPRIRDGRDSDSSRIHANEERDESNPADSIEATASPRNDGGKSDNTAPEKLPKETPKPSQALDGLDLELIAPPLAHQNDPTTGRASKETAAAGLVALSGGVTAETQTNRQEAASHLIKSAGVDSHQDEEKHFTDEEADVLPSAVADETYIQVGADKNLLDAGDKIDIPSVNEQDTYDTEIIRIRVDQVVYPKNKTRKLDVAHVGKMKTSFRDQVSYTLGHMSVCHKPSVKEYTPTLFPEEKFEGVDTMEKPVVREVSGKMVLSLLAYYVINGMHRGHAFHRLFNEAVSLRDRRTYGVIEVTLYKRKDGKEMSFYELLALGGRQNDKGYLVTKPPTFADQVDLSISCVREILFLNPNKKVTFVGIGEKFAQDRIIQAKHPETHMKYAQLAWTFVHRPTLYKGFQDLWAQDGLFRIGHFQSSIFHDKFTEEEQIVVLKALHHCLLEGKGARHFSSSAANHFCMECRDLLNVVNEVVEKQRAALSIVLLQNIAVTKTESISLETYIVRTISRFDPNVRVDIMGQRCESRVKRFRKLVEEAFFPKTEAQKKQEELEKKRKLAARKEQEEKRLRLSRAAKAKARKVTAEMKIGASGSSKGHGKRKRPQEQSRPLKQARFSADPNVVYTVSMKTVNPFDDEVPAQYPKGYASRPAKWTGPTAWVRLLTIPPHRLWSQELFVKHAEPWLHGMGVPRKHRAHILLSAQDLERNHHAVYYHATLQAAKQVEVVENPLYDAPGVKEKAEVRASRIAKEYPDMCQSFLASCRESVMDKGYCVIEGIFDDSKIPSGPTKTVYDEQPARKVFDFYAGRFPSEEEIKDGNGRNKYWSAIFNNSTTVEEDVKETAQGRFTTSRSGLFEHTERDQSTVHIAKCRAALDVRALQICVSLGLEETGLEMLGIPATGSRLLTSTLQCDRQIPHADFETHANARDWFSPRPSVDYSVIWTADDPFPIILWEYSHILQCGTPAIAKKIAQTAHAKRVLVPPFSCIVFRGDMMHCGPGWKDHTLADRQAQRHSMPIRSHLYIIRWGSKFIDREKRATDNPLVPDTVYFIDKFQPDVQQDPDWIKKTNSES